jgi:hypothetical protein
MPGTINRLEIFAAGTWSPATGGKMTITEAALDEMAAHFTELNGSNIVKPHLKLGHGDAQKWFGQGTGIPTLGWVDRVWREGSKLFADISNVPEALLEMIRLKRYHNVSIEMFTPGQIEFGGKKLGHVLSAIALLGTEMPAVKDLAGLANALFATPFSSEVAAKPIEFTAERNHPAMFTQEQVDSLIAAAVSKAVTDATAKFAADNASHAAELQVMTARAETAERTLATNAAEFAQREAVTTVDQAIKDGKLLPAQKDMALAFMSSVSGKVSFGGTEKPAKALFAEFLASFGKQVNLGEQGDGHQPKDFANAAAEVDHLVRKRISADKSGKTDYATAFDAVRSENPTLMSRYAAGE